MGYNLTVFNDKIVQTYHTTLRLLIRNKQNDYSNACSDAASNQNNYANPVLSNA